MNLARAALLFSTVFALAPLYLPAATSTTWETGNYADYLKGRLFGLSLSSDGVLLPGHPIEWQSGLGQPALWSMAVAPDGSAYAATGHSGKIIRISPDGTSTTFWTAKEAEVFAIAMDSHGTLWAGTSPNGGVFRFDHVSPTGLPVEVWHSPEKYIWSLLPVADGSVLIGTGSTGRIYRLGKSGKAVIFYETGQANITSLAPGKSGAIYAGSDPNGLLYEISAEGKGNILYDSTLPEIHAIVTDTAGNIYASALGGALSTRSTTAGGSANGGTAVTAVTPTVITVTEAAGKPPAEDSQAGVRVPSETPRTAVTTATSSSTTGSVTEVSGVERSAIYKILPDRTVETIRTSKEDNVYDLLWDHDSLVFSTDDRGRIYQWRDGKNSLLAELGGGETTRLVRVGAGWYAGMSNPARVVSLGPAIGKAGKSGAWFESQVHDSGSVARWGHLLWRPAGSSARFRTRTGNALRPDATWSNWSEPITDPDQALVSSPVARYIQWRAEWPDGGPISPLNAVSLGFLPQNAPPVVRSMTVSSVIGANAAKNAATTASSSAAYSITVTDSGDASAPTSTTTGPNQTASRLQSTQTQVSWQADDPDGDKLVYSLYFRSEDATEWQLIRSRMYENTLLLDPDVLADGRYYFRVVASDAPANAESYAKKTDYVSASVLIDNTPPVVSVTKWHRDGMVADLSIDAKDSVSALRRAEFSLDAGWWQPLEALDGVTDTPHEQFAVHIEKLKPGEHLVVLRVYDAAGNAGLAKILLH